MIACEDRLEEAVHFLVRALDRRSTKGKKPVVIHSLRASWRLLELGFDADVAVAGLLHDVLEKTTVREAEIARRFGPRVARYVAAATNDVKLRDPLERYADSVARCQRISALALTVRAADLMDNFDRLVALGSVRRLQKLAPKFEILLRACRSAGAARSVIEELARRQRQISRRAPKLALAATKRGAHRASPRRAPRRR
jgi:GTP pyrophosphokinase